MIDFDNLDENGDQIITKESIPYSDFLGAIYYVFMMCLGYFTFEGFEKTKIGDGIYNSDYVLYFVFILTAFTMIIHLLNMLIAIMGNTFSKREPVRDQIRLRDHLTFVIEHWYMNYLVFNNRDTQRTKYVITAFIADEEDESQEILSDLNKNILKV